MEKGERGIEHLSSRPHCHMTTLSHDLRHQHPGLDLVLVHEEGVEHGDIVRQHSDAQLVFGAEVIHEIL